MLQNSCIDTGLIVYWAQLEMTGRICVGLHRSAGSDDKNGGRKMITSLYQSLCNMETNIADRVALRWYDEEKQRFRDARRR